VVCPSQYSPSQSVRSLMVGYAQKVRERRWIVMLKCFVDDSGSHPRPDGKYVLAGYIMQEPRWEDFAEKWQAKLDQDPKIDYFHMADAHSGDGPFRDIRLEFREFKVAALANVIRDVFPPALAFFMSWESYNRIIRGKVDPRLDNPYAVLFFKIMAGVSEIQKRYDAAGGFGFHPVDFIFDNQGVAGLQCLDWYYALRDRVPEPDRTIIANDPQFKDDRQLLPLQAADMLAWHIRRHWDYPNEDRRNVMEKLNPDGIWEYNVPDSDLEKIAYAFNNQIDLSKLP
jgi:hypothetical protein